MCGFLLHDERQRSIAPVQHKKLCKKILGQILSCSSVLNFMLVRNRITSQQLAEVAERNV